VLTMRIVFEHRKSSQIEGAEADDCFKKIRIHWYHIYAGPDLICIHFV